MAGLRAIGKTSCDGCNDKISVASWRHEMTNGEQRVLWRGVAAGTIVGLAVGLMIALVVATKPGLFAGLMH
jgi:hypothetical protein